MKIFLRILKYIILVTIILMLINAAYDFYSVKIKKEGNPIICGFAKMIVTKENENQQYKDNAIIILKKDEIYNLGDYLAIKNNKGEIEISQIAKKDENVYYILNNNMIGYDTPVIKENIIGKVFFHIPVIAGIVRFLSSILGITILIILFVGVAVMEFVKKVKKKKNIEKVREMYLIPDAVDSITVANIKKRKEVLEKKKEEKKWKKKLEPTIEKKSKKKIEKDVNKQIVEEHKKKLVIFSKTKGKH